MSIPTTANAVLAVARAELGNHENPPESNRQKYGVWARNNGVAWCATYVTWVFAHAGCDWRGKIPGFAYTPTLNACLQKKMRFKRVPPEEARPGDVVFFDFPDSVHRIQHVGIVADNDLRYRSLRTYEGNTSVTSDDNGGEVMERYRGYSLTASILRPPYAAPKPVKRIVIKRVLKVRNPRQTGPDVLAVRKFLGLKPWPLFDRTARDALVRWQRHVGLTPDGEFGPACAAKAGMEWRG